MICVYCGDQNFKQVNGDVVCRSCEKTVETISNIDTVKSVQSERGSVYGDFGDHADAVEKIMKVLEEVHLKKNKNASYPQGFETSIFYMVSKLVRLATTPYHEDSALDLSSYSDLWLKEIKKCKK